MMRNLDQWAAVLLSPVTVYIGALGLLETIALTVTSFLVVVYVTRRRRRHGNNAFLRHVIRVTGAAYVIIAFCFMHDEYEVTPFEMLMHDILLVVWFWLSVLPLLLKKGDNLPCASQPLSPSRDSCLTLAAMLVQLLLAVSIPGTLLTSACTPTMHWDWLLFPSDCSRVYQNRKPAKQFVSAVLCLLYAAALLPCCVWQLRHSPFSVKGELEAAIAYFKGGNSKRRRLFLVLTLLQPFFYYCVCYLPIGCHSRVRRVVSPWDMPRLNPPSRDPYCQPRFDFLEVSMPPVNTLEEAESVVNTTSTQTSGSWLGGGSWEPRSCRPWQRVAIIVPFRHRDRQLVQLLATLHPFLQRQLASYTVFVVEQAGEGVFNRGKVKDAGFLEAERRGPFHCYVFHDVDMLPERQDNLYLCDVMPRHLCPALDEMRYTLPSNNLFGGAVAVTGDQFRRANGYPTLYWGWGAEDDDLSARLQELGMYKTQPPNYIGRYKMLRHVKDTQNPLALPLLITWKNRWKVDGISNPELMSYKVVSEKEHHLYTHITVDVGQPPSNIQSWMQGPEVSFLWRRQFYRC